MMDNAVTEISRDYFTLYRLFVNEADGRQRLVSPICQIFRQAHKLRFKRNFKTHLVFSAPLIFPCQSVRSVKQRV